MRPVGFTDLEWIGHSDRSGKTWCDVSSLSGKAGVVFAYPSEKPETAPDVAGLIVGFEDDADPDGAKFEACASRVTASLTALAHEKPMTEVRVFVLTKPDGFRTKVLHSGRYSVERLLTSAEDWKLGARNQPTLKIRQFGATKGAPPFWSDPFIPYPAEVVQHCSVRCGHRTAAGEWAGRRTRRASLDRTHASGPQNGTRPCEVASASAERPRLDARGHVLCRSRRRYLLPHRHTRTV